MVKIYLDGVSYNQFGHDIFFTQLKLKTFLALFDVDSNVQRELDPKRKLEIRAFILDNLEQERDFQFTSFVFTGRNQLKQDEQGYYIEEGAKLYISDGQHRSLALEDAYTFLKSSLSSAISVKNEEKITITRKRIATLENFVVSMQIYKNLDIKQERQLFSDLNTERKEAHPGLLLQYDHRDVYSTITRELAQKLQGKFEVEMKAARVVNGSSALTTLVMMKRCIVALIDGLYFQNTNKNTLPYPQQEVEQIAEAFFLKWLQIFPKKAHRRTQYVTGLTGIQVALALTVHHLTKEHRLSYPDAIEALNHLQQCSWQHNDPIFQFLFSDEKQSIVGHSNTYAIRRIKDRFVKMIEQERLVNV